MPLYEYYCELCKFKFEQLTALGNSDLGKCPQCDQSQTRKLISLFLVGGRGDLRESTLHGCHDAMVSLKGDQSSHNDHHDEEV